MVKKRIDRRPGSKFCQGTGRIRCHHNDRRKYSRKNKYDAAGLLSVGFADRQPDDDATTATIKKIVIECFIFIFVT